MLSNALSILTDAGAGAPATPPAAPVATIGPMELAIAAIGVCVLVVCIVRRLTRPRKLALNNTPGRPNSLTPIHVVGLFLLWQFVVAAIAHLAAGRFGDTLDGPDGRKATVLAAGIGSVIMLALSVLVAARTFRLGLRRGLGLSARHWIYDSGRALVAYLAVIPVCWGLLMIMRRAVLTPEQIEKHKMLTALAEMGGVWRVLVIFAAVVLAPLAEEIFFRGLLQSMLRRYLGHAWGGILITSAFFAIVHVPHYDAMPALFVLSVVLGYNYERCGRLYAPILIHVIFNGESILSALVYAG